MDVIDSKTNNKIGTGKVVKLDDESCYLYVTPSKNGTIYYHLSVRMTLPQPYETMIKIKEIAINDIESMANHAISEYEDLIQKKIQLLNVEYTLKSNTKRPYTKKELRKDLDEYLQIPHHITLLKETNSYDVEKYTKLMNRKTKLEEKLIQNNILNKDGTFK